MFKAIADVLRSIGSTLASVVTLPFRAVARLFGGASSTEPIPTPTPPTMPIPAPSEEPPSKARFLGASRS